MAPRALSTNYPAVKGRIPTGSLEIEQAILDYSHRPPAGPLRVAQRTGSAKASTSVRAVCVAMWQRPSTCSASMTACCASKTHREQTGLSSMTSEIRLLGASTRVSRTPNWGSLHPGTGGGRHLLRRRTQGVEQVYLQTGTGLLQPPRLGTALHQQAAGDLGPCAQRNGLPFFREAHEGAGLYHPCRTTGASSAGA